MMSATIDDDVDGRTVPVVRQWLRTAELQGERRYENRIDNILSLLFFFPS